MATQPHSFELLFDPLCGWCYGAHPIVRAVIKQQAKPFKLTPTGLFARDGGREMDAGFAAYAWQNDQRIMKMTGQVFSDAYKQDVLDAGGRFDSWLMTVAFHLIETHTPAQGLEVLEALQQLRYVQGQDVSDPQVLASVAVKFGLERDAFIAQLTAPDVVQAVKARIEAGQQAMRRHGVRGVPALVVETANGSSVLPSLYDPNSLASIGVDI